jgi:hypothetical protein
MPMISDASEFECLSKFALLSDRAKLRHGWMVFIVLSLNGIAFCFEFLLLVIAVIFIVIKVVDDDINVSMVTFHHGV